MSFEPLVVPPQAPSKSRLDEVRSSLVANAETVTRLLPEFDHVSITVVDGAGNPVTCAQAGDLGSDLDRLQYGMGEGPCIDSIANGVRVVAPNIQRDGRWGRYVPAAAELGLRAQLAAPVGRRGDGPLGALNLYSTTRDEISTTAPLIAHALASQVVGVLESSREIENLHRKVAARKTIGIAVGLLMAEHNLSETAAFAVLRRHSSLTNVELTHIATRMVADGNAALVSPTVRAGGRHATAEH